MGQTKMKLLLIASLFVLSVFAEPEADAQWYNWGRNYPMSYGYNRWNNGWNSWNYNRYNMYSRNFWGNRRFYREAEAEAEPEAEADYYNVGYYGNHQTGSHGYYEHYQPSTYSSYNMYNRYPMSYNMYNRNFYNFNRFYHY